MLRRPAPRSVTCISCLSAVLLTWQSAPVAAASTLSAAARAAVEEDWARHDAQRMAQLTNPGLIRLPGRVVNWPGLPTGDSPPVPLAVAPVLDGALSEACWSQALELPPEKPENPSVRVCHDGQRLYVGIKIPRDSEHLFRGDITAADAGGAVDGVKNGIYDFHCGHQPNPWWQVDLGKPQPISRIIVYNRLDYKPGLHNADNLNLLVSDDGESWTLVHENRGKHFGGVSGAPPLDVSFRDLTARFVRLQIPSEAGIFFHLDEVEVYGPDDPERNLALHQPARQSSLSIWSRGGAMGSSVFGLGRHLVGLTEDDPPGVTLDGRKTADGAATPGETGMVVEVALPLELFGGELRLAGDVGKPVRLGAQWELTWPADAVLGYGPNAVTVDVQGPGPFDPPLAVSAETICLGPLHISQRATAPVAVQRPGPVTLELPVEAEGPTAAVVTVRQGKAETVTAHAFFVHPVRETVRRGQQLLEDFGASSPPALRALRRRMRELEARESGSGPDPSAREALYREARWLVREIALSNPALEFERLLLVKRHTQQAYPDVCLNHMPWVSRPGGDICTLSPLAPDGAVTPILQGALGPGHVHGMDLSPDGKRTTFGYARSKTDQPTEKWLVRPASYELRREEEPIHIFEVNVDGTGLRQLTDGEWSDLDPTYLPNGDVAFVSERCAYSLQCNEYDKDETSCNLYAVSPDTGDVRRLTVSKDGDYLPHTLDNGLLAYTRWEYQERSFAHIQSIWTVAPDGTGADALFRQHLNDPWALEEMRSIPGSHKLLAIATGHHTLPAGPVVVVDQHVGINDAAGIGIVTPGVPSPEGGMAGEVVPDGGVLGAGGHYMTPWPLSEEHFLVSYAYGPMTDENGYALYLIDVHGTRELIYRDPGISCFYPTPLRSRFRPPLLANTREPDAAYATCIITDIHERLEGLEPGSIRYLRVSQRIAWPYDNTYGGHRYEPDVKSIMVNWTPARVLGTVPVEPDGSAHFRVPADTPVYFQALDENQMELRRMRSFIKLKPGEVRSCAGCHETQAVAPQNVATVLALQRAPSPLKPAPWGTAAISFLRDVQPVLDRHCVRCHSGLKPTGGLDFSGGLTESYNRAYETINAAGLVARSNVGEDARVTAPLSFGSHKSRVIEVLRTSHRDRVSLPEEDRLRLVTWIDANAPYHSEFINKRAEVAPYNLAADTALREAMQEVHGRRCAACHNPADVSRLDWIDLRQPANSLFLAAPWAADAGGKNRCGGAVYADAADPDYALLLQKVTKAVDETWARPRRDVVTLRRPGTSVAAR